MSRRKKNFVGKVGYCENKNLPGIGGVKGGHYVFIRSINGNKCDVNIVTSLEDKNGQINLNKIKQVKKGNIYSIPVYDSDFSRWSGIGRNSIKNVKLSDIQDIGKKRIKKRHRFFIGKFIK